VVVAWANLIPHDFFSFPTSFFTCYCVSLKKTPLGNLCLEVSDRRKHLSDLDLLYHHNTLHCIYTLACLSHSPARAFTWLFLICSRDGGNLCIIIFAYSYNSYWQATVCWLPISRPILFLEPNREHEYLTTFAFWQCEERMMTEQV